MSIVKDDTMFSLRIAMTSNDHDICNDVLLINDDRIQMLMLIIVQDKLTGQLSVVVRLSTDKIF